MREKVFDKLVDEVTERVVLRILNGHFVCYQCGERSIKERFEKLEQKVERCMKVAGDDEIVRCKDCRLFKGDDHECCIGLYVFENDFCSMGVRRVADGNGKP